MLPMEIVWRPSTGTGYEHLKIREKNNQILVDSIVIGRLDEDQLFRLKYDLVLDQNWVTREVTMCMLGEDRFLRLTSDGNGIWRDEKGEVVSELSGCVDIDLSCTPFTNTLPIRRLSFDLSQQREIKVVYISARDLVYKQVKQKYTLLDSGENSSVYQYQSGNFQENITVDSNGIVLDYPNLFFRETI
ncbi:putative glycolipid-binding domain-containing protein [Brevibacillus ginsengisoli]|uniref:putative glycolipid-binding domain-containing protein n=1 Tax=Brevibacillus ginsengisoli TaxID=363854 RepID=UPI003CEDFC23